MNIDGVDYPIRAIECTSYKGDLLALVECKYYTKFENVDPGEEEIPFVDEKKDFPIESDLVEKRNQELTKAKAYLIRYECPFCKGQFKLAKDCVRHYNGKKAGREEPAREVKCPIRKRQEDCTIPSSKKPNKIVSDMRYLLKK